MGLDLRHLIFTAGSEEIGLFLYEAGEDTRDDLLSPGYFDQAEGVLRRRDIVLCSCQDGGVAVLVTDTGQDRVIVRPFAG